jgi:hypothetical protein
MKFTLSNVFTNAFSSVGRGFVPLLIVTVLIYLLPNLLIVEGLGLGSAFTAGASPAASISWVIPVVVMVLTYLSAAMHMSAIYEICVLTTANKPVKIMSVIGHSLGNAFPILLIYILCALGWTIGSALIFIPGMIFGTVYSLVVPAYVSEKPGIFGAFSRSAALTKGHRWGIFGLWVLIVIIFYILIMLIEIPVLAPMIQTSLKAMNRGAHTVAPMPSMIVMVILSLAFSALWVLLLSINASVYSCLRAEKDRLSGLSVEKLFE